MTHWCVCGYLAAKSYSNFTAMIFLLLLLLGFLKKILHSLNSSCGQLSFDIVQKIVHEITTVF